MAGKNGSKIVLTICLGQEKHVLPISSNATVEDLAVKVKYTYIFLLSC